ncbi:DUF3574 domain-containing protein [Phenylobacterium sp.]|uniref:DUF3574 domain-containing protein n=1 Tax=Phenylobacterium sp. TaxID=1871053 RepID=UPI002732868E|nr:DUF3574 domain-containing protein [Phenylobacterium sp.]MDP3855400.1 DUF3574 domain-containing protein [Phenylobacterium sp.]
MVRLLPISACLALLTLSGCATLDTLACPAGQEPMRTAQLFFGRNIGDKPGVTDADFRAFVDHELTPRFPEGLTVLDGGGQWKGDENKLIREASKIVVLVLPTKGDSGRKLDEARKAYVRNFRQDSVMLVTQPACVAL